MNDTPSIYDNRQFKKTAIGCGEIVYLTRNMFTSIREGFVELQDETFIPSWTGYMHISGICNWKRAPIRGTAHLETANNTYTLMEGDQIVQTFVLTIPAEPVRIRLRQENAEAANAVKFNLTYQAVK